MPLEGRLQRAQARFIEEAVAQGAGVYLLGCPIVELFNEAARGLAPPPRARSAAADPGAPREAPPP